VTKVTSRTTKVLVSTIVAVRTFFRCFLKDWSVAAVTTCSGKEFQIRGSAAGKARLPTVGRWMAQPSDWWQSTAV